MKQLSTLLVSMLYFSALFAQTETKVLFIGIDGVRSDALTQANTPNIDELIDEGTYTFTSWHLRTTVSGPSWSAMLTGVWEEKHGVLSNNYTSPNWNDYPYFPTRVKEYRPDAKAVQITSWAPMSDKVFNDGWDQKIVLGEDDDCVSAGVALLQQDPDLDILFIHIDDVDATGHANGFNPNQNTYINAIEYADVQVGQIMAALKSRSQFNNEDWIVMLTTDHGGIGNGHGGVTKEEREIWWVGWSNKNTLPEQELLVDLSNLSTQDYILPNANDFNDAPLLVDIAVTAIDHLLPGVNPETESSWDLDGKSWLNKTTTGINKIEVTTTTGEITPNPTTDNFTLSMKNVKQELNYRLFDLQGKILREGIIPFDSESVNVEFDLSDQPIGTYLLEVSHADAAMVNKIIKQ